VLEVVLAWPRRRNAMDAAMRTALADALSIACYEPTLRVRISALGPDFCAGGDLDEFGTAADPATAHLVRVVAGVGGLVHELRDRITVHVHGACVGAGVELPCFAGRVVAARDSSFRLPEVGIGLIPGAGGTVSIPRRIDRWRTLWLALRGRPIDADTALSWGLVDAVE
jgi:enoyl-CoA hydratase/carnithine racemase